jgi:hypothetical protein
VLSTDISTSPLRLGITHSSYHVLASVYVLIQGDNNTHFHDQTPTSIIQQYPFGLEIYISPDPFLPVVQ